MMILDNGSIRVKINSFGAELKSLKKDDVEYLWQGDPKYWGRTSPVLFPIVGRLLDDEYFLNGKTYTMTQHGFARDNEFQLIESTETSATYKMKENEDTLSKYPYKFDLYISYEIVDNKVEISYKVENTNEEEMYFSIGAHPAFDFLNGSVIEIDKKTTKYNMYSSPYIQNVYEGMPVSDIFVDDRTFSSDALIFGNIDKVVLRDSIKYVRVDCVGFPYVGLWSNYNNGENAPFICIEPWYGITDFIDHEKNFVKKEGVIKLMPGYPFKANYSITVG